MDNEYQTKVIALLQEITLNQNLVIQKQLELIEMQKNNLERTKALQDRTERIQTKAENIQNFSAKIIYILLPLFILISLFLICR